VSERVYDKPATASKQIELPAKLLDDFLWSGKSNTNQRRESGITKNSWIPGGLLNSRRQRQRGSGREGEGGGGNT